MCKCLKIFEKKLADKYIDRGDAERCLVQRYFEEQAKLPPAMQSSGAYISCPCKRCTPYTL